MSSLRRNLRGSLATFAAVCGLLGAVPATMAAGAVPVSQVQRIPGVKQATPRNIHRHWWASKPNGAKTRRVKGRRDASLRSRSNRRKN